MSVASTLLFCHIYSIIYVYVLRRHTFQRCLGACTCACMCSVHVCVCVCSPSGAQHNVLARACLCAGSLLLIPICLCMRRVYTNNNYTIRSFHNVSVMLFFSVAIEKPVQPKGVFELYSNRTDLYIAIRLQFRCWCIQFRCEMCINLKNINRKNRKIHNFDFEIDRR